MAIFTFIIKNIKLVLIGIGLLLIVALVYFVNQNKKLRSDRNRIENNFTNLSKDNVDLRVTVDEFKTLKTKDAQKIDSLLKVANLKPKFIQGATVINTVYRDTGSTKVIYKDMVKLPDGSFKVPFNFDSQCWGIKAEILSKDQSSTLNILERKASNSAQLIVTKNKYFLGFLWRTRKADFKAYSDCGNINFTKIEFIK